MPLLSKIGIGGKNTTCDHEKGHGKRGGTPFGASTSQGGPFFALFAKGQAFPNVNTMRFSGTGGPGI